MFLFYLSEVELECRILLKWVVIKICHQPLRLFVGNNIYANSATRFFALHHLLSQLMARQRDNGFWINLRTIYHDIEVKEFSI